jgi:hypothetical protein
MAQQLTEEEILALYRNLKALQEQKQEMLADIKLVLEAIIEIGEKFQDKNKIMGLISALPRLMLSKDANVVESLIPMAAFKSFAEKYGPVCFPETLNLES